jgi:protein involved in polysaccharide export with SLBB domain
MRRQGLEVRVSACSPSQRHTRSSPRSTSAKALLMLLTTCTFIGTASAGEYKLGAQDRIRVKVIEWRASIGEAYEWLPLTGEYIVNAEGRVFLPLIGEVSAAGLSLGELSRNISTGLKNRVGLVEPPNASVEIVQFRPFYIIGSVERSGEYPYRSGLTVLQAIGIAGGFYRPADATTARLEREAITARSDMRLISLSRDALLVRKARLQSEEQDSETITLPPEITQRKDDPAIAQVVRDEQMIFDTRRNALQEQLAALERLKKLLTEETESLTGRIELQDRQLGLIQKELKNVGSLVERGLAVAPRQLALERSAAEIEAKHLEIEATVLRARQDFNRAERDIADLKNQRRSTIALELRQTQASLDELAQKLLTADRLVFEAEVIAPQAQDERARAAQDNRPIYAIVRKGPHGDEEKVVSENTPVEPGDIIKVQLPINAAPAMIGAKTQTSDQPASVLAAQAGTVNR